MRRISRYDMPMLMAVPLMASSFAAAQMPEKAPCLASRVTFPPGLERWSDRRPLTASADPAGAQAVSAAIGHGVDLALHPTAELQYAMSPAKADEPTEYGGLLQVDIKDAGTYRVALGAGAWIDLLAGTASIASIAHARGPECSDIRKMVDFQLTPGHYILQISAGRAPVIPLMIARLP
jgi:hypothetical protein